MTGPRVVWMDQLIRATTLPELADVLEGFDEDAVATLHQFLERTCETFRERGDERRAAAFAGHVEALRLLSDELAYTADDLRAASPVARSSAARSGRAVPAAGPGTQTTAANPPPPASDSLRSR
jgi:hypothetical protein